MFKKNILSVVLIFVSTHAMAMETLVTHPSGPLKGLVVIAPAKKYLMKERLFSQLAEKLTNLGYATVRFNWSPDTLQVPELELQRASRDIVDILQTAQRDFVLHPDQTILISKSFSTKALDASLSLARTHILLTPNCSNEAPFQSTYWNILNRLDLSLKILISNEDPYCDVNEILKTLNFLSKINLLTTSHGDHNFTIVNPTTNEGFYGYQDTVVDNIIDQLRPANAQ